MLESLDIQQALLLEMSSWVGLDWGMTAWCLQFNTSSDVHPSLIGCFGLLSQCTLTEAHHRLISPGCDLHKVTWHPIQSPSASATARDCFFRQQLQGL